MKQADILTLLHQKNGMLTAAQAVSVGISRSMLQHLVNQGYLLRPARGVYTLPDVWEDDFLNLQTRFKRGVFSHETALFLWNLTDRTPVTYHMTFPATYNLSNPRKAGIRCAHVKLTRYSLGMMEVRSPAGNTVRCYSMERTLCDILRPRHAADIQIVSEAFKRYTDNRQKNIPLLSAYAKCLGVEKKVRPYLEVLL